MSTAHDTIYVPEWDMADRLRKTLRESGEGVQESATYFGVSRNTVSNWINGHVTPDLTTQKLWALKYGVPLVWLQTGERPTGDNGPADGTAPPSGLEPETLRFTDGAPSALVIEFPARRSEPERRTA